MSHLTMGELARGGILPDPQGDAVRKILELRQQPGYGETMLRRYADVIPGPVFTAEIMRLRAAQDARIGTSTPAAAWTAVVRSYRDHDADAIRAWEASVNNAGARRSLDWSKARARDQASRIFGMRTAGLQGMGHAPGTLVTGCFGPMSGLGGYGPYNSACPKCGRPAVGATKCIPGSYFCDAGHEWTPSPSRMSGLG